MSIVRVYDEEEVESPFDLPGMSEQLLIDVLISSEGIRAEATDIDAPTRGGTEAYFAKVRELRIGLLPFGWTYSNASNYCTTISPCRGHAIAVAAGTWGTGLVHPTPETARSMGEVTTRVVEVNQVQLSLFNSPVIARQEQPLTWLLLSHRAGDRLYAELSLPDGQTENGVVCTWRQRFVLSPSDLGPSVFRSRRDDGEPAPAIDVPVALRR